MKTEPNPETLFSLLSPVGTMPPAARRAVSDAIFLPPIFLSFSLSRATKVQFLETRTESGRNFRENDFPVPDRDNSVLSISISRPMMNKDAIDCIDVIDVRSTPHVNQSNASPD